MPAYTKNVRKVAHISVVGGRTGQVVLSSFYTEHFVGQNGSASLCGTDHKMRF